MLKIGIVKMVLHRLESMWMVMQVRANVKKNDRSNLYPKSCNHKRISKYYLLVSITFGISGTIISLMIRFELDSSSNRIMSYENLNIYLLCITLHGLLMIFYLVMPILIGSYGNYLLPICLGASEIIYPRINNISILIIPTTYEIIMLSMICEYGIGIGWTLYPPLSTSINLIVTLHIWKPLILTFSNIDIYVWSLILIGYMLIIVLPILAGSLLMILSDLHYNTIFFDSLYGGDPIFYQHIFWFFAHPEVYILMIPSFGLLSNILSEHINVILFGYQSMILAMSCITYLGSLVWSHHMFTIGMEIDSKTYFISSTLLISLPTSSKMFNWLCTYLNTYLILRINNLSIIYIKMFLIMFTLGGSTGLILGNNVIDISLHDTYYIVAHFHIVLSLGTIMTIFIGLSSYQEYLFMCI